MSGLVRFSRSFWGFVLIALLFAGLTYANGAAGFTALWLVGAATVIREMVRSVRRDGLILRGLFTTHIPDDREMAEISARMRPFLACLFGFFAMVLLFGDIRFGAAE